MAGLTYVYLAALSAASAQAPCPPTNPFCPVWVPCNYTANQGPYCQDCKSRVICTPIGGLVRPCWLPHKKNCVDGQCVTNPSEECSPPPPPPTEATSALPETPTSPLPETPTTPLPETSTTPLPETSPSPEAAP